MAAKGCSSAAPAPGACAIEQAGELAGDVGMTRKPASRRPRAGSARRRCPAWRNGRARSKPGVACGEVRDEGSLVGVLQEEVEHQAVLAPRRASQARSAHRASRRSSGCRRVTGRTPLSKPVATSAASSSSRRGDAGRSSRRRRRSGGGRQAEGVRVLGQRPGGLHDDDALDAGGVKMRRQIGRLAVLDRSAPSTAAVRGCRPAPAAKSGHGRRCAHAEPPSPAGCRR